jgi:hypothetical protein
VHWDAARWDDGAGSRNGDTKVGTRHPRPTPSVPPNRQRLRQTSQRPATCSIEAAEKNYLQKSLRCSKDRELTARQRGYLRERGGHPFEATQSQHTVLGIKATWPH